MKRMNGITKLEQQVEQIIRGGDPLELHEHANRQIDSLISNGIDPERINRDIYRQVDIEQKHKEVIEALGSLGGRDNRMYRVGKAYLAVINNTTNKILPYLSELAGPDRVGVLAHITILNKVSQKKDLPQLYVAACINQALMDAQEDDDILFLSLKAAGNHNLPLIKRRLLNKSGWQYEK